MYSLTKTAAWLSLASGLALAACVQQGEVASGSGAATAARGASDASPRPGGMVHWGATIASMADQYARPILGGTAATGASAWVPPAPAPAYVATGPLPEPDAPAPPLAAVANRQPSAPAVDASQIVRPEAAGPDNQAPPAAPRAPAAAQVDVAKGRQLFANWSCGSCHGLADAKASGSIGPSFDNNPRLTLEYTRDIIHDGRGAMPAFGGQISDPDIATLAAYIVQVSRK